MAALPPPVNVVLPAGPATPESPILVDANDAIVGQLPWLNWAPAGAVGGLPRVAISHCNALAAFALKCKVDRAPAALAAMNPINPLTLKLTAGAWSRILTAVRDSGLAALQVTVVGELHEYIKEKVPIVIIGAVDWDPAPAWTAGNNAAARAASGRVRFLGLANVASLEVQSGRMATTAPWTVICKLAGAMGPVGTQASRLVETSRVQQVAELVRAHGTGGSTDAALALGLRGNVLRAVLPKVLCAHGVTEDEQIEELADGFAYKMSEADRRAIEQKRVDFTEPW